jgi:hypothetical protein
MNIHSRKRCGNCLGRQADHRTKNSIELPNEIFLDLRDWQCNEHCSALIGMPDVHWTMFSKSRRSILAEYSQFFSVPLKDGGIDYKMGVYLSLPSDAHFIIHSYIILTLDKFLSSMC